MSKTPGKTILAPLDGSGTAETALPVAVEMARRLGARILLVSVPQLEGIDPGWYHGFPGASLETLPLAPIDDLRSCALSRTEEYLQEIADRLKADGVEAETSAINDATPAEAILRSAEETDPFAIVMASHGRHGVRRWALGSVATKVLQRAQHPLLLVRTGAAHLPQRFGRILVGLDGSDAAEQILGPVMQLARANDSQVTLIHVVPDFDDIFRAGMVKALQVGKHYKDWAEGYLESRAAPLRDEGIDTDWSIVAGFDAAGSLLEAAHEYDLVAMTTHGGGGGHLLGFPLGSVADRVACGSERPVLLARAPGTGKKG